MKKIMTYLITLNAFLLLGTSAVNAECTYTQKAELNKKVANVKIDYEAYIDRVNSKDLGIQLMDGDKDIPMPKTKLSFYNIDSDLYLEGTDSVSGETITKTASDMVNGSSTVEYDNADQVRKFTFKIYASDSSACPGEALKTVYVTIPRYNEYSEMMECANSDFYLCKEFVTVDEVPESEFISKFDNYDSGLVDENGEEIKSNAKWYNQLLDFMVGYKYYIGGGILAILVILVIIRRIKTKKQRELGL